jgi:hypothetical protein
MLYLALFCLNISQFTQRYPSAEVEIVNAEMMDPSEKVAFRGHYNRLEVKGLDIRASTLSKRRFFTLNLQSIRAIC